MKIAILLSGGVDSSTALWRLKEQGYTDIVCYYLKIWLEDDTAYLGDCPWEEDLEFARRVCAQAGVELRVVPLQLEYYDKVVSYALVELKAGRTPSPDIFCNQRVKFGAFFDRIGQFEPAATPGAGSQDWKVASGHYARVDWLPEAFPGRPAGTVAAKAGEGGEPDGTPPTAPLSATDPRAGQGTGRWRLLRGPDPVKDQSYFLSHLSQAQLSRILFPVGGLHKAAVRSLARQYGLANQDRPDSQGICFLGKIRYPDFVRHYLGVQDGAIIDRDSGAELGRHEGFWFHTTGQRAGLGLGNGPWYVSAKDCRRNIVYVSHGSHAAEAARREFAVGELNWLPGRPPAAGELAARNRAGAAGGTDGLCLKLRHGPHLAACRLEWDERGADTPPASSVLRVSLTEADRGVAPGQFAVFYLGEECLGSGKILEHDEGELETLWQGHLDWVRRRDAEAAAAQAARRAKRRARRDRYGRLPPDRPASPADSGSPAGPLEAGPR